jgi:hypothetical protein
LNKTIFARMQSVKAGAKLDPETSEDLSNVEKVLNRYNIALRDSTMEFRPLGNVIDDVAQRWTALTNVEQSQITMALAGKNLNARTYGNMRNLPFIPLTKNHVCGMIKCFS